MSTCRPIVYCFLTYIMKTNFHAYFNDKIKRNSVYQKIRAILSFPYKIQTFFNHFSICRLSNFSPKVPHSKTIWPLESQLQHKFNIYIKTTLIAYTSGEHDVDFTSKSWIRNECFFWAHIAHLPLGMRNRCNWTVLLRYSWISIHPSQQVVIL